MSHKRAALTVYRALLRQARQVPQGASLIIRNPVDIEAFQRNPYSWAQPADGAPRGRQGPAVAQRIQVLTRLCFPAEICRETLKDITPFSTKVPDHFTQDSLFATIRDSFKSSVNASTEDQSALQDTGLRALRALADQVAMMQSSSSVTTERVNVDVTTVFVSDVFDKQMFTYRCRIENRGPERVQLLGRHWQFKNSDDSLAQEVPKGSPGVVGNTPIIPPGACFQYHSATHIDHPGGSMQGSFQMMKVDSSNDHFDAVVGQTRLIGPSSSR